MNESERGKEREGQRETEKDGKGRERMRRGGKGMREKGKGRRNTSLNLSSLSAVLERPS